VIKKINTVDGKVIKKTELPLAFSGFAAVPFAD
jgi:hypothetical protein